MSNENETNEDMIWIRGAFVWCEKIKGKKFTRPFLIKLSSITLIEPVGEDSDINECIFYTYKDCAYYIWIHPNELRAAINSFIFEPEKHWERYPD